MIRDCLACFWSICSPGTIEVVGCWMQEPQIETMGECHPAERPCGSFVTREEMKEN